jgi:uncharacterized membrane-anchored protein YhcB (DUF1043 family)
MYKKWVMMGLGFIIGTILGYVLPNGLKFLQSSLY